ncbi:hypothetical protein ACOMHN_017250 [Nucella lapillus]
MLVVNCGRFCKHVNHNIHARGHPDKNTDNPEDITVKMWSPVNRIPIMAKQTLDLYELFRLVVSKGGLVEVINKKLWREITKGLNLPSSITSAAFTLRTQYMKYLYPYECDKLKLSNPSELQAAIDGNRREGRRSSYGYDLSPGPTLVPSTHPLSGSLINGKMGRGSPGEFVF